MKAAKFHLPSVHIVVVIADGKVHDIDCDEPGVIVRPGLGRLPPMALQIITFPPGLKLDDNLLALRITAHEAERFLSIAQTVDGDVLFQQAGEKRF